MNKQGKKRLYIGWMGVVFGLMLFSVFGRAQDAPAQNIPQILMLEVKDVTPDEGGLYTSILAQFSGEPLVLERVEIANRQVFLADPRRTASLLVAEKNASMVFWIEDKQECRLFFFIPDVNGGRINSRVLQLDDNRSWNRYHIMAIAAAGMVESLLVTHHIKPKQEAETATEPAGGNDSPEPQQPEEPIEESVQRQKWLELSASYAGSLFAENVITHGVNIGLGVRPGSSVIVGAAFRPTVPIARETDEYRLTVSLPCAEVAVAREWMGKVFDFRLGLAWAIDFRSFSFSSRSDTIDASPAGFKAVHALVPFISAGWRLSETIGFFFRVGAGIALNDTTYQLDRNDGMTDELAPYPVRFQYQSGLNIQI
ncbi:MAG: hypothetical protein JXR45_10400 [Deltaproteobacteria bacterium]|nr:hypothetical protein [Deltaproteobacteria bacterium]